MHWILESPGDLANTYHNHRRLKRPGVVVVAVTAYMMRHYGNHLLGVTND